MLSNATNQPKSTVEIGYMCPRGLTYQKDIATSAREAMLRTVCTRAQVQGLKECGIRIRGDEDQSLVSSEEVWTNPVI